MDELRELVESFFEAVSFAEGERPVYAAIHDLFIVDGKLIRSGPGDPEILTVTQFTASRGKLFEAGELTSFRETESAATTEFFGNVAHRFSTYRKEGVLNGTRFAAEGVISTQFIRLAGEWKMSSMAWDDERPGLVIPERYR
ncbi:DUF4440 domain-containing protein [Nonomuraea sp. NPDC050680]|uniref:DUF4440 domain-containing protein n=1 Tax=Nonomuraea sp. NPDC050680 TaxID=3154630 RepID=UPI00340D52CC